MFTWLFKVYYPLNRGNYFIRFWWFCACDLILNLWRSVRGFCTKIYDSIKYSVHHSKNQPRQEVEDGYIFVNIFVKTIWLLYQSFLWCSIIQAHIDDCTKYQTNHIMVLRGNGNRLTHTGRHIILEQSYCVPSLGRRY